MVLMEAHSVLNNINRDRELLRAVKDNNNSNNLTMMIPKVVKESNNSNGHTIEPKMEENTTPSMETMPKISSMNSGGNKKSNLGGIKKNKGKEQRNTEEPMTLKTSLSEKSNSNNTNKLRQIKRTNGKKTPITKPLLRNGTSSSNVTQ